MTKGGTVRKPTRLLLVSSLLMGLMVAAIGTTTGQAQTPDPTTDSTVAPSVTAGSATPVASPTPKPTEAFELSITLKVEVNEGRQQVIADGAELIARSETGICARAPLDAAALNRGSSVSVTLVIPPSAGCGEPKTALAIEILFPGESRGGYLNFSTEWEQGVSRSIGLTIPAPIFRSDDGPGQLPSTGSQSGDDAGWSVGTILGAALFLLGGGGLLTLLARRRST